MVSYIKPILIALVIAGALYFLPRWGKVAGQEYFDAEYPDNHFMESGPLGRGYYYRSRAGKGGK